MSHVLLVEINFFKYKSEVSCKKLFFFFFNIMNSFFQLITQEKFMNCKYARLLMIYRIDCAAKKKQSLIVLLLPTQ